MKILVNPYKLLDNTGKRRSIKIKKSIVKNIIYVGVFGIASLIVCYLTNREEGMIQTFLNDFVAEINFMYSLFVMSQAAEHNDYTNVMVVPILYIFISRMIYYVLENDSWIDSLLQIIGNCFLQIFILSCIVGAPKMYVENFVFILAMAFMVFVTIGTLFEFIRSPEKLNSPFFLINVIKYELKYIRYVLCTPVAKNAIVAFLAFMAQSMIMLVIGGLLEVLHIVWLIIPLSFIVTPFFLKRISDLVIEFFNKEKEEDEVLRDDIICFIFAIFVLVIIYMPFWSYVNSLVQ